MCATISMLAGTCRRWPGGIRSWHSPQSPAPAWCSAPLPPAAHPPPKRPSQGGEIPVDEASLAAPFLTPEVEKFLLDGAISPT